MSILGVVQSNLFGKTHISVAHAQFITNIEINNNNIDKYHYILIHFNIIC